VRFGAKPVRFGNSSFPTPIPNPYQIQNSSYGPSCYQIDPSTLETPPGGRNDIETPLNGPVPAMEQSEDCLFLDIYVPAFALEPDATPIPVVAWINGGAYVYGSKLQFGPKWPFYSGQGLIEDAAGNGMIFVAGNYRLGAFGWLAGLYMEKAGLPNAGLYDQRLMLAFIQDHIGKVGGDKTQVSAWGESAGAGSILHHIIQRNGTRDPLFTTALLQSPAFEWQWDRAGTLSSIYNTFSNLAGCPPNNIECLRNAPITGLVKANQLLFTRVHQTGLFPVGPSVDKNWIDTLAPVQFANSKSTSDRLLRR
jgi:carboxylesterase type B